MMGEGNRVKPGNQLVCNKVIHGYAHLLCMDDVVGM